MHPQNASPDARSPYWCPSVFAWVVKHLIDFELSGAQGVVTEAIPSFTQGTITLGVVAATACSHVVELPNGPQRVHKYSEEKLVQMVIRVTCVEASRVSYLRCEIAYPFFSEST